MKDSERFNCMDNPGNKRRILAVTVIKLPDEDPDLSWLGAYSDTPDPRFAIDRKERGDMQRNEFRYFNPSRNYDGEGIDNLKKYTEQDYKRMELYNAGEWKMIGIKAWASVQLGTFVVQKITSMGLWGIESDAGAVHFTSVSGDQLDELRVELMACGFKTEEIDHAFKEVKYT